jgi:PhnB protein
MRRRFRAEHFRQGATGHEIDVADAQDRHRGPETGASRLSAIATLQQGRKKRREIVPVTPYLFFDGRCEEAIEFYKKALGAEVGMMMRFNESPEKPPPGMVPPGSENKIMHACIRINGADVMASDGNAKGKPKFEGFSLTLNANDEAAADRMFAALADGGQVQMPLGKTFFAKRFGMVADRFGVGWMIIVEA